MKYSSGLVPRCTSCAGHTSHTAVYPLWRPRFAVMGHPGWTMVPQRAFLESRIPDYHSIQKTSAWPLFWKPLFDDWFKQWPTGADDPAKKKEDEDNMRRVRSPFLYFTHTRCSITEYSVFANGSGTIRAAPPRLDKVRAG